MSLVARSYRRRETGSLELALGDGAEATVVFASGYPVKARTRAAFYLVPILAEIGVLHESELPRLLPELLAGKELHGRVLVAKGFLTEEEVERGLHVQLERQLAWMGGLPLETTFRFVSNVDLLAGYGGEALTPKDPLPVLWSLVRTRVTPDEARASIAKLGQVTFHLAPDAVPSRFGFDERALAVAETLQKWSCRADEIASHAGVPEDFAALVLHALLIGRQAVVVSVPAPAPPGASESRELLAVEPDDILSVESVPPPAPKTEPPPSPPARQARAPLPGVKAALRKHSFAQIHKLPHLVSRPPIPRSDPEESAPPLEDSVFPRRDSGPRTGTPE